ncbi:hypothetical protein HW115_00160 [Verrucomicrobiaceae bacterium N1E253]|uniref:GspL cytoplasmic actin-ATPase-like domain-containing protein n=1 Tax=Oceaniferula marina TaxID=2748318 RepID=A0A851G9A2_9BACT|nr:hypothetical protein [Oceaniferula marina]NWK54006.1 hypothetical protein [Oceaniferula marina]
MSKKTDNILILPGPDGWELWQGTREQGFRRILEDGPALASELDKIPSGFLMMGFPVREALAVPFKAQTDDEAMFEDLAAMQLEKIGVRPELGAGQLTDVFAAACSEGETTLLSVVLAPPPEGTMPMRSPKQFDLSARMYPMEDNAVTLWCELGRWVFAVTSGGRLTYFQSLPGTGVTEHAVREVKLALNQLRLQGVDLDVQRAVVWATDRDEDPKESQIREFVDGLGMELVFADKPSPVLPTNMSKLVPADVRAEQRLKQERLKRNLGIAAVVLAYFGLAAYFGYDYWGLSQEVNTQQKELDAVRLEHKEIGAFNSEWDQLAPVVEDQYWPMMVLKRAAEQIPPNQDLRFKVFDATMGQVTIRGEAADIKLINAFNSKLRRALPDYDWEFPPAEADAKTNRRTFNYTGILEGDTEEL